MSTLSTTNLKNPSSGSNNIVLDSSGRVLVGTSTSLSSYGINGLLNVASNGLLTRDASFSYFKNDIYGPILTLAKSRSDSIGTFTYPTSGDLLGTLAFSGAHTGNGRFDLGVRIDGYANQTWTSTAQGSYLTFSTTADGAASPTERMRISSGGNLLVNRTAQTAGERFAVYTDVTSSNTAYFWYGQTDDRANVICRHDRSISGNVGVQIAFLNQTGSNVGQISSTGSATTYTTSSDYRLKENVVPLTNAINRFNQLQVYRFNFIADSETVVDGFIAHEVQSIVPEAIVGEKDAVNQDGSMKPQGIDQSKLVPLLTAALQEAVAEIKALKDRVTALEGA